MPAPDGAGLVTSNAHKQAHDRYLVAKDKFNQLKLRQDEAKRRHAAAANRFKDAKNSFLQAKDDLDAFKARQHEDKKVRQEQKEALAQKAGIPRQYWNDLIVKTDRNGTVNIYFGGSGCADGSGHGHASIDSSGHVTYMRNPYEPHGAQNYTDYEPHRSTKPDSSPYPWSDPEKGSINGQEVTFSYGISKNNRGHTLIADGHEWKESNYHKGGSGDFFAHNHDHYGPGNGSHHNGTDRGIYTGDGSQAPNEASDAEIARQKAEERAASARVDQIYREVLHELGID